MTIIVKKKVCTKACGGCSAELSYEPSDVVHYEDGPFGYDTEPYAVYAITCPACGKENRVEYPGPGFKSRSALRRAPTTSE